MVPRVLDGGAAAFAEVLRQIDAARERIEVRAFVWRDDRAGNRLARALLTAAERGVAVDVYKDRVAAVYEYAAGTRQSFFHKRPNAVEALQAWFLASVYPSSDAPPSFRQRDNELARQLLAHRNVSVTFERKRFDHSKVFIFDDQRVVLGSMGIGDDHCDHWVDVMVALDGAGHVARLRERLAGTAPFDPHRRLDFLLHAHRGERGARCPLARERLALIAAAERSLVIEMAYLGDARFTRALIGAVRRGVDVTLLTSERADILGDLNLATCRALLRATGAPRNLTILLHPRNVHSKLLVADGRYCDVGSANFTPLSHGVYEEINLYADDPPLAAALIAAVERHAAQCRWVGATVRFRRVYWVVERAIVAYQARGAR